MGIYQSCYDLIHTYVYGGVELTANMDLVCILVATAASLFCIALPFLVVWKMIKLISGI